MTEQEREAAIARIADRLRDFDDFALERLDVLTDEARAVAATPGAAEAAAARAVVEDDDPAARGPDAAAPPGPAPTAVGGAAGGSALDRRRLLTGGAVVTLGALGTALALRATGTVGAERREALALHEELEARAPDARLRELLPLVTAAIGAISLAAGALTSALAGLARVAALFEEALAPLEAAAGRIDGLLRSLDQRLDVLRAGLAARGAPALGAAEAAVDEILAYLPPGIAAGLQERGRAVREIITLLPTAIAEARNGLLESLSATWLGSAPDGGLRAVLLSPLADLVSRAEDLAARAGELESDWSAAVAELEDDLDRRDALREQIAAS